LLVAGRIANELFARRLAFEVMVNCNYRRE
jgi:hypothetical protein